MEMDVCFSIKDPKTPIIATAIHNGHNLREEAQKIINLNDQQRLMEEDPFTGEIATAVGNTVIVNTSRFEVDLNRSRDEAVYVLPEDAWGLQVWRSRPDKEFIETSLDVYDSFYEQFDLILKTFKKCFKSIIILDIHAYNHRRNGPESQPADPEMNPEVNIGTGTMNRKYWSKVVDRFIFDLSHFNYFGRNLDVRENVKFRGRQLAQWTHDNYPENVCVLSIEFKKFFMDEWTGKADQGQLRLLKWAIESTIPGLLQELSRFE